MAIEGVDYAWSRPDPAELYAAGKRFASRYLSYDRTGKNLTAGEAAQLAAAGIAVVCNWEWQEGDASNGYDTGRTYALEAVRQAAAVGMPAGRPIYFSVDFDPAGAYDAVDAYFRGIASVLPVEQIGAYGGYDTIDHLLSAGLIRWAWQTYAWSAGRWHPGAHVQQYRNGVIIAGGDLDLNRALVDDFGQWGIGEDMTPEQLLATRITGVKDGVQWDFSLRDFIVGNNEAAYGAWNLLKATSAADEIRDKANLAAITALANAGGVDAAPIVLAIERVRDEAREQFTQLHAQLAEANAEVDRLRAAIAAGERAQADAITATESA